MIENWKLVDLTDRFKDKEKMIHLQAETIRNEEEPIDFVLEMVKWLSDYAIFDETQKKLLQMAVERLEKSF